MRAACPPTGCVRSSRRQHPRKSRSISMICGVERWRSGHRPVKRRAHRQGAGMRKAAVKRKTKETDVAVEIDLDGSGAASIATGIGFFDHMLDLLARHSRIDMKIEAKGDL